MDHQRLSERQEQLRLVSEHQLATAETMCKEARRMAEQASAMMIRAAAARAIVERQRALPMAA